jgi:hypothetical protein
MTKSSTNLKLAAFLFTLTSPLAVNGQLISQNETQPTGVSASVNRGATVRYQANQPHDESEREELSVIFLRDEIGLPATPANDAALEIDRLDATSAESALSDDAAPSALPTVTKISPPITWVTPSYNPSGYSFQRDGIPNLKQRQEIRAMPIETRPHRPLHFYGNAVRRSRSR